MTVLDTTKDTEALTLTLRAELAAPPERVWQLWEDPRQLERWWGPPEWPATFVAHDVREGGRSHYFMTGPDGERMHGWWRFEAVDEPRSLAFVDGFADDAGEPAGDMPETRARLALEPVDAGTRMTLVSSFASLEQMQQLVEMGMEEGLKAAVAQMDALLAG